MQAFTNLFATILFLNISSTNTICLKAKHNGTSPAKTGRKTSLLVGCSEELKLKFTDISQITNYSMQILLQHKTLSSGIHEKIIERVFWDRKRVLLLEFFCREEKLSTLYNSKHEYDT